MSGGTGGSQDATGGFRLGPDPTPARELIREVWHSRPLVGMLARKDFLVQYRRASFGVAWALLLPLAQAAVLAVVLGRVANISTEVNYVTFIFAGMVVWTFLSGTIARAAGSVVEGSNIASKVYFPRAVLPLVSVGTETYGFIAGLTVLIPMCVLTDVPLGPELLLLPVAVAAAFVLASAFGLLLGGMHVYFRDIRYLVTAAIRPLFYLTPVFYPLELADGRLATAIEVNPATGVVQLVRYATVGAGPHGLTSLWWTAAWTVAVTAVALQIYRRHNRVFVDRL